MKFWVSEKLCNIYKKQGKNYEYAIDQIMNCLDPESFVEAFNIIDEFGVSGEKCEIAIRDSLIDTMIKDLKLENMDNKTVELVLWLGAVFPEV